MDDGSPDSTAAICRSMQDRYPNLHVLERKEKSGIGSAYRAGFAWGLEKGFDEFIEMDADGSHQVGDLVKLIDFKAENPNIGLVIGSRWIKGGKTENWSKSREALEP